MNKKTGISITPKTYEKLLSLSESVLGKKELSAGIEIAIRIIEGKIDIKNKGLPWSEENSSKNLQPTLKK